MLCHKISNLVTTHLRIMHLILLLLFVSVVCETTNAPDIDDLEAIIGAKGCVEASLMSLSSPVGLMLERVADGTSTTQSLLRNISAQDVAFEKSVGAKINELAQHNEVEHRYELLSEEGPPHNRVFKVLLKLGDESFEGEGQSLKKAQNSAAGLALRNSLYEHPPAKINTDSDETKPPTVVLNNVAAKLGMRVSYFLVTDKKDQEISIPADEAYGKTKRSYFQKLNHSIYHSDRHMGVPVEGPQIAGPFTVKAKIDTTEFVGFGHTIQAARHDAAANALEDMKKQLMSKDNICASEENWQACKQKRESLKNPITRIFEAGQKHNVAVEFIVLSESGPSHRKQFVTQCRFGAHVTEGLGKSKKESRTIAAQGMLEYLDRWPDINDGSDIVNALTTQKKSKTKKKVFRTNSEKLGGTLQDVLNFVWGTPKSLKEGGNVGDNFLSDKPEEKPKMGPKPRWDKNELLEVGNLLGVEMHFADLANHGGDFYALLSLEIHPSYVCLGKGVTRDASSDNAAWHGFKLLHKYGMLDKIKLPRYKEWREYIEKDNDLKTADKVRDDVERASKE